jgi:antitoxin YefM
LFKRRRQGTGVAGAALFPEQRASDRQLGHSWLPAHLAFAQLKRYTKVYTLLPTAMPRFLTITETRKQLLDLPDQLKDEPVIITKHGKPAMVALNYEQFESLVETIEVLSDSDFMAALNQSVTQIEKGETITLEDAVSRLGL